MRSCCDEVGEEKVGSCEEEGKAAMMVIVEFPPSESDVSSSPSMSPSSSSVRAGFGMKVQTGYADFGIAEEDPTGASSVLGGGRGGGDPRPRRPYVSPRNNSWGL